MASDGLANRLAEQSVGFATKEDYKRKREELEKEEALNKLRQQVGVPAKPTEADGKKKKGKKEKKEARPSALSFGDELEEEEGISPTIQAKKMGKNNSADVSFLKKNDREAAEEAGRQEQAVREYLLDKERRKDEPVTITYMYRSEVTQRELPNGAHRGSVVVKQGSSAEEAAKAVLAEVEKLGEKFETPRIAGVRTERELAFVAYPTNNSVGGFIIPGSLALFQVMQAKWSEGTSLFEGFKGGVIVTERRWYEQMRHTYPYSQWTPYDEQKAYSYNYMLANREKGFGGVVPAKYKQ